MAKKKKRPNLQEDDVNLDDAVEPAAEEAPVDEDAGAESVDAVEEVADEEAAHEVESPGDDEEAAAADDADKDVDADKETEEEEEKPRARTTVLTMFLAVLNILAACGFAFLLLMDFGKRHDWEYASVVNELALDGLPLKEQDKQLTADQVLRPPVHLDPAKIAEEFKKRKSPVSIPEKDWLAVNETLQTSIKPSTLTKKMLDDMFRPLSPQDEPSRTTKTLEEEAAKVKTELPGKIEAAAKASAAEAGKKPADEQRQQLKKILLPMAYTTKQVDAAAKLIETTAEADLPNLRIEAVQRKMYFDLVRLIQMYRQHDTVEPLLQEAVGADAPALDVYKQKATQRIDNLLATDSPEQFSGMNLNLNRESYEKRDNIAFFLVATTNLRVPPDGQLLYPREQDPVSKKYKPTRAQITLGLVEYVKTTNVLAGIVKTLAAEAKAKIAAERDGVAITMDKTTYYIPGFVVEHQKAVERLVGLVGDIESRKKIIAELKVQLAASTKLLKEREDDKQALEAELLKAIAYTKELAKQKDKLQQQLFAAQKELAGIMELNEQTLQQIIAIEDKMSKPGKKGK